MAVVREPWRKGRARVRRQAHCSTTGTSGAWGKGPLGLPPRARRCCVHPVHEWSLGEGAPRRCTSGHFSSVTLTSHTPHSKEVQGLPGSCPGLPQKGEFWGQGVY